MKLYRTSDGPYVEEAGKYYRVGLTAWDALVTHEDLHGYLLSIVNTGESVEGFAPAKIEAPIGSQEVWGRRRHLLP